MLIPNAVAQVNVAPLDGWTSDLNNPWTYVSSTSFSTTGDRTVVFSKGTRIKVTDGTVKYFVVTGSSFGAGITTVTITGGSDYSLSGGALSFNYYSYGINPQGYPQIFNYSPTWRANSSNPTLGNGTLTGKFSVVGKMIRCHIELNRGSTSSNGTGFYSLTLPVNRLSFTSGISYILANSNERMGWVFTGFASDDVYTYMNNGGPLSGWTNTQPAAMVAGDTAMFDFEYEMA